jgi:hypothetical protein
MTFHARTGLPAALGFILCLLSLAGCASLPSESDAEAALGRDFENLHGFNFVSTFKNGFARAAYVDKGLHFAREEGANFLAIDWMVNFKDDGHMVPGGGAWSSPLRDVESVAVKAKQAGFYVMLKPHVCMEDTNPNRNLQNTPTEAFSPSNFFPDWMSYLSEVAAIATERNIDAICIGTEMNNMDWRYKDRWVELIAALRQQYGGELTYDAIAPWSLSQKGFPDVVFWDELDFIGCSLYIQISRDDNTDVETLQKRWRNNPMSEIRDVIGYLKSVAYRHGKRFMALESGYPSVNGSLSLTDITPAAGKTVNEDVQRRGIEAYLGAMFENRGNWLRGISLWDITPNMLLPEMLIDPWHTQGYAVYGKQAAATVKEYYSLSWQERPR